MAVDPLKTLMDKIIVALAIGKPFAPIIEKAMQEGVSILVFRDETFNRDATIVLREETPRESPNGDMEYRSITHLVNPSLLAK